ncbi:MAG: hypothetical protein MUF21_03650 [Gemmatimonadaceae bacterium]|jgi:hypothetical protein|nr:hypothetical protein [Gemmatimonadaceae bacterium]
MDAELERVMREAADRLRSRNVTISMNDDPEYVAQLLEAIERFELEVERQGGDLMVDSGDAEEPDDPRFVLPRRQPRESLEDYRIRIDEATVQLRRTAR